jgi:hypothetical protein
LWNRNPELVCDWMTEVDAGSVVAGFGTAACAFGVGAARRQGDMDRAYPLTAQALLAARPLLNGTLLGPRLVSNLSDAPLVGAWRTGRPTIDDKRPSVRPIPACRGEDPTAHLEKSR